MLEKNQRHELLSGLVQDQEIGSQAELLDALADAGLEVHQSTLSRDLRELGIRKVRGRYRMKSRDSGAALAAMPDRPTGGLPVVHDVIPCGPNLVTVRTGTGQAQHLGVLLDASDDPSIAGTIAGDDTVLVVTKNRAEQRAALSLLERWFGGGRDLRG